MKIGNRIKLTSDEYKTVTSDFGVDPCLECDDPNCCGCIEADEWRAQFTDMPKDLADLAKSYGKVHLLNAQIKELRKRMDKLTKQRELVKKELAKLKDERDSIKKDFSKRIVKGKKP